MEAKNDGTKADTHTTDYIRTAYMQGNKKSKSATHVSYGNNSNYKNITDEPVQLYIGIYK